VPESVADGEQQRRSWTPVDYLKKRKKRKFRKFVGLEGVQKACQANLSLGVHVMNLILTPSQPEQPPEAFQSPGL
jgi:hypothetical protein